jgi:hypothetical protein
MANKDILGYRQTVYSRPYEGSEWVVTHTITEPHYMFFATDENWSTILPDTVKRTSEGTVTVTFPSSVRGNASIFRLTPLLNFQIVEVFNTNYIKFNHKYHTPYFIVQTWDSDGNLVLPKIIRKENSECEVYFHENFSGVVICVFIIADLKEYIDDNTWEYKYRKIISRGNILIQNDDDIKEVILPKEENRIEESTIKSYDNRIQEVWGTEKTGSLISIIHGYRI